MDQWALTLVAWAVLVIVLVLAVPKASVEPSRAVRGLQASDLIAGATLYHGRKAVLSQPLARRRLGLLFGLNYVGTRNQLGGCIRDVQNVSLYLSRLGYQCQVYTDLSRTRPTRATILALVRSAIMGLRAGDTLAVWYSGHGTILSGRNAWVPLDFQRAGCILEADVRALAMQAPVGTRLFVGADCCYSGSFMDLKYDVEPVADTKALQDRHVMRTQSKTSAVTRDVFETVHIERIVPMDMPRALERTIVEPVLAARASPTTDYDLYDVRRSLSASRADIVFVSGSRDNQVAYDAFINGTTQGAMTWSFLSALQTPVPNLSFGLLQDLMRAALKARGYPQVPQVSFGNAMSPTSLVRAFRLAS